MRTLFVFLFLPVFSFAQWPAIAHNVPTATFIDLFEKHIEDKPYVIKAIEANGFHYMKSEIDAGVLNELLFIAQLPQDSGYSNSNTELIRLQTIDGAKTWFYKTESSALFSSWFVDLKKLGYVLTATDSDSTSRYSHYAKGSISLTVRERDLPVGKGYYLYVRRK